MQTKKEEEMNAVVRRLVKVGRGNLLAYADVDLVDENTGITGMTIKMKLLRNPDGKLNAKPVNYIDSKGKWQWVVRFPNEISKILTDAISDRYKKE